MPQIYKIIQNHLIYKIKFQNHLFNLKPIETDKLSVFCVCAENWHMLICSPVPGLVIITDQHTCLPSGHQASQYVNLLLVLEVCLQWYTLSYWLSLWILCLHIQPWSAPCLIFACLWYQTFLNSLWPSWHLGPSALLTVKLRLSSSCYYCCIMSNPGCSSAGIGPARV